jgi:hypothetical protein
MPGHNKGHGQQGRGQGNANNVEIQLDLLEYLVQDHQKHIDRLKKKSGTTRR